MKNSYTSDKDMIVVAAILLVKRPEYTLTDVRHAHSLALYLDCEMWPVSYWAGIQAWRGILTYTNERIDTL